MILAVDFDGTVVEHAYPQIGMDVPRKDELMILAVDFDGTVVEHAYPQIGMDVPGAFEWLERLDALGVKLILWTMRSGETLDAAVEHCRSRGVEFWGVNVNPDQQESGWSTSPKAYAHLYVDDAAVGVPLARRGAARRAFVDWQQAGPMILDAFGLAWP